MSEHPSEQVTPPCGLCGRPALGNASINDVRYCHGDNQEPMTCFMAQWQMSGNVGMGAPFGDLIDSPVPTPSGRIGLRPGPPSFIAPIARQL